MGRPPCSHQGHKPTTVCELRPHRHFFVSFTRTNKCLSNKRKTRTKNYGRGCVRQCPSGTYILLNHGAAGARRHKDCHSDYSLKLFSSICGICPSVLFGGRFYAEPLSHSRSLFTRGPCGCYAGFSCGRGVIRAACERRRVSIEVELLRFTAVSLRLNAPWPTKLGREGQVGSMVKSLVAKAHVLFTAIHSRHHGTSLEQRLSLSSPLLHTVWPCCGEPSRCTARCSSEQAVCFAVRNAAWQGAGSSAIHIG